MDFLHTFFALNRSIILFVYGLVFFVMGLAIALQSRRYSRLDLAHSLRWLAAFGFTHGLHEWGDMFIPIQATYLSEPAVQGLYALQLLLLGVSFACLFQFGIALLQPAGIARWLHGLSAALLLLWVFAIFFIVLPLVPDLQTWHHVANALARYLIGFPGGLLAAYGLRRQTFQRIALLNVPHIVSTLRVAGISLALYAVFGGLIPPPVSFFPGNVLNRLTFEQAFGLPPLIFRSAIGLVLALTIIRALEVFELETARMIETMEQQQILAAERDRIARDLHDGAIQTVYTAGLLVESAQLLAPPESPVAARLEKALAVLNDAIRDLRHNLNDLRAAPSSLPTVPLAISLRRLGEDPRFGSLIDVALDLDLPEADGLSPLRTDHILAIVNEALSNVIRHARARRVEIAAHRVDGQLSIVIRDDGIGLVDDTPSNYGLRNMRDRARLLGGSLTVTGKSGKGTIVQLGVPWGEVR